MYQKGDHVHHSPTGEDWVVLRAGIDSEGEFVEPAGWPACRARASDCSLIEGVESVRARGGSIFPADDK